MNKYQGISLYAKEKSFIITTTVAEFKRLIKSCNNSIKSDKNEIVFNSNSNVKWEEVEIEKDNITFYQFGFLEFDFELLNETIYYQDLSELGDYDTISINCISK